MAYEIGTAAGHKDLLSKFKTFVEVTLPVGSRWTAMFSDLVSDNNEIIWKAPGLSGTEEIYMGLATYQDVTSDYYNWRVAGFTGYVAGNLFNTQPGFFGNYGCPLWNNSIPYWFVADGQRAIIFTKVQDTYNSVFLGKFLPYATPSQYPYPIAVGGMLSSPSATRYSASYSSWWKGATSNSFALRFVNGSPIVPYILPFANTDPTDNLRNTAPLSTDAVGYYGLHPLTLISVDNVYGEIDGLYMISGFNNAVENTVVIGGVTYVVLRDSRATGFKDYVALRLS